MLLRAVPMFVVALTIAASAQAHDIITTNLTYSRDISRIFARRCVSCHGEGSSVALTTYDETRPWAVDIKEQVLSRAMPPWGAVKGFGNFAPDNGLTQEEILIVSAWVVGGAPEGDTSTLPKGVSAPRVKVPTLEDALTVSTSATLKKPITVYGIEPVTTSVISSARIVAQLPDGRTQPLVWLYQYNPEEKHAFVFREPLLLPARTRVLSNSPLEYVLKTAVHSAVAEMVKTVVFTRP